MTASPTLRRDTRAFVSACLLVGGLPLAGCGKGVVSSKYEPDPLTCSDDNPAGQCPDGETCTAGTCSPCATPDCTEEPQCANGQQDGDETAVDCGGDDCPPCGTDAACSGPEDCDSRVCSAGQCAAAACDDGQHNGDETDFDCGGGTCAPCADESACGESADCASGVCDDAGACAAPTCTDATFNGTETHVDCGGPRCPPCTDASACVLPSDCTSGVCDASTGICEERTCQDGVRNGDEAGVDCGGPCLDEATPVPCDDGVACTDHPDCISGICVDGACRPATCTNGSPDGDETDTDCGGAFCPPCEDPGAECQQHTDCDSGVCLNGSCRAPTCTDSVPNADETDVDCGGPACDACPPGRRCVDDVDCGANRCVDGVCRAPSCSNGVPDGDETDVDCGGSCPPCQVGECIVGSDCHSGVCTIALNCAEPTCSDGVLNGAESDVDCGEAACGVPCTDGEGCLSDWDCDTLSCDSTTLLCVAATCTDRRKNGNETGVDCGGFCGSCDSGGGCTTEADCDSRICTDGVCATPACNDTVRNGDETDVDCGGSCVAVSLTCADGGHCSVDADCATATCTDGTCAAPHCSNDEQDEDETALNCGGAACPPCDAGLGCETADDCATDVCTDATCAEPACDDTVHNGDETDIDCGGSCNPCADGAPCLRADDCSSGVCTTGFCQAATCSDAVPNGTETDVDCGGSCNPCPAQRACSTPSDCNSQVCTDGVCQAPSCDPADNVQNGFETDLDCGGTGCPPCSHLDGCLVGADCSSGVCSANLCLAPSCNPADGVHNGTETDVDCGGDGCPPCEAGQACDDNGDCATDYCTLAGLCAPGDCGDGEKNGDETDADCGGSCDPCTTPGADCLESSDCASLVCSDGSGDGQTPCDGSALCCQEATCSDEVSNGTETDEDCGGSCDPCSDPGTACLTADDCLSRVCSDGSTNPSDSVSCEDSPLCCQPPTCNDGVHNDDELDTDCGGIHCGLCDVGQHCTADSDCLTNSCDVGDTDQCLAPACDDGSLNGEETSIDCGGSDPSCPRCDPADACSLDSDCASEICGADGCTDSATCCQAPSCGDGIINQATEACDDGNNENCGLLDDPTNCLADCSAYFTTTGCGDGVMCGTEECDNDTSNTDGDGCTADCRVEYCGDGVTNNDGAEQCDDGNDVETDDCLSNCKLPSCGDGAAWAGHEACDDGNDVETDDCLSSCELPSCGDGVVWAGHEACDDGNNDSCVPRNDPTNCMADCTAYVEITGCGDGVVCADDAETCDALDLAGESCVTRGYSGGVLQCSAGCDAFVETACLGGCGNGRIDGLELCDGDVVGAAECADFSNYTGGTLACNATCDGYDFNDCVSGCGNGIKEGSETCDGYDVDTATCSSASGGDLPSGTLKCNATCDDFDFSECTGGCGNGVLEGAEQCDGDEYADTHDDCADTAVGFDGGILGCNAATCLVDVTECTLCDGNALDDGEQCDAGVFAADYDDCTDLGFDSGSIACHASTCTVDTSGCNLCGNGVLDGSEVCDGQQRATEHLATSCTDYEFGNGDPYEGGDLVCNATCDDFDTNLCINCPSTCPTGATCSAETGGLCACPVHYTLCDGVCVQTRTDPANCGGCGVDGAQYVCDVGGGEACSAGVCTSDGCQPPLVVCTHASCAGQCVDPNTTDTCCSDTCDDCTATSKVCVGAICKDAGTDKTSSLTDPNPSMCAGGGPPILINEDVSGPVVPEPIDCTGDLGAMTFRFAVCSCTDAHFNGGVVTDGFDSRNGPYAPTCEDGVTPCTLNIDSLQAVGSVCSDANGDGLSSCTSLTGGSLGVNAELSGSGAVQTWGILWWNGTASSSSLLSVRNNFHAGSSVSGRQFVVDGDAWVRGDLNGNSPAHHIGGNAQVGPAADPESTAVTVANVSIAGDLTTNPAASIDASVSVGGTTSTDGGVPQIDDPCDCSVSERINVAAIIDAHACTNATTCLATDNNDNAAVGLVPNLFASAGGKITLPCGHYYFSTIEPSNDEVSIVITGRTAIYVDGHIDAQNITFALQGSGELDLFVRGGVCGGQGLFFGSPNFPARARMYVGGGAEAADVIGDSLTDDGRSNMTCSNSARDAVKATQGLSAAGNIYAPWGSFGGPQDILVYGSLFLGEFSSSQSTAVHYDKSINQAGDTCPADCGNGELDDTEVCDGLTTDGQTCITQGFSGGTLVCLDDCSGFDTSGCYDCGDGIINAGEACDPGDPSDNDPPEALGGADCASLGIANGTLGCRGDCTFDTSQCYECGNGVAEVDELCDGNDLGDEDCQSRGYDGGLLACDGSCQFDPSQCYVCGDGTINPTERCEPGDPADDLGGFTCALLGYDGGDLRCRGDCLFDVSGCRVCGDFIIQSPDELCDGTSLGGQTCTSIGQDFDGGTLACATDCTWETSGCTVCGDGAVGGTEACDPGDPSGTPPANLAGETCETLGFDPDASGALACTAQCTFNTSECVPLSGCGDGILDDNEQCDPGDTSDPDPTPVLGTLGCSDFGYTGGEPAGCLADCTLDLSTCTFCGNGEQEPGEPCDGTDLGDPAATCDSQGFANGDLACLSDCTFDISGCWTCGDGQITADEQCDPGNGEQPAVFGDHTCETQGFDGGTLACSGTCALDDSGCTECGGATPTVDPGEDCEPTLAFTETCATVVGDGSTGTLDCNPDCTWDLARCAGCGNGMVEAGEQCDGDNLAGNTCISRDFDGGTLACTDGCVFDTSACTSCGDGFVDLPHEDCDGDNLGSGIQTCTDLGALYTGGSLSCNSDCSYNLSNCEYCGDGRVIAPEECDGSALGGLSCQTYPAEPAYTNGVLTCTGDCSLDPSGCYTCGDGALDGPERCDHNGTTGAGEGGDDVFDPDFDDCSDFGFDPGAVVCSSTCSVDVSACAGTCTRNGSVESGEACDDSNTDADNSDDLFRDTLDECTEYGYEDGTITTCNPDCTPDLSDCSRCGDGIISGDEVCDGNKLGGGTCEGEGFAGGGTLGCLPDCSGYDTSACVQCSSCRDCDISQACRGGECTTCTSWTECCSGMMCFGGICKLP